MNITEQSIPVVEEYISIQGEGQWAGSPSVFIRTNGCNLRCQFRNRDGATNLCDTAYTSWFPETEFKREYPIPFAERILKEYTDIPDIVITGGEPLLHQGIVPFANYLLSHGKRVTIETNGTIFRSELSMDNPNLLMSLSPKLKSSYPIFTDRPFFLTLHRKSNLNLSESVAQYITRYLILGIKGTNRFLLQLKFVVCLEEDFDDIQELKKELLEKVNWPEQFKTESIQDKIKTLNSLIWIMPEGITPEQLNKSISSAEIIERTIKENYRYSDRIHIRIFGPKRGV